MDAVRSILQPITQNLPAPIVATGRSLLSPVCYKTLVVDIDPFKSPECLKLAVSKGLGIGIIGASSIVKVPQLIKLINSQSAEGVSFLSYLLESGSYLISLSYNIRHAFPFSTYGETALILVQNVIIAALVLKYSGSTAGAAAWVAGLATAGAVLFREDIVDVNMLQYLQAGAGVLGVASKAPQILSNWRQGGTGQLSAFAVFNYLLGSLSRIFTTLQEVPDRLILYSFIAGFALNAILAFQMVYYWNSPSSKTKTKTAGSKKQKHPIALGTGASAPGSASYAEVAKAKAKSPTTRRRG